MPLETPPEKTMRRFYEVKLAERLMQAASLERNRRLLRRGARKQQDGTLGEPGDSSSPEDDVNIHIGDIHQLNPLPSNNRPQASGVSKLAKSALVAATLLGGGGGIGLAVPWLLGAFDRPATTTTTNTYESQDLGVGIEVIPGGGFAPAPGLIAPEGR
jgi:hypothetical protein